MYHNRDLSWLEFNYQLLQEAASEKLPLYERFKFLAIHASNLDEFFCVRYPVIMAMTDLGDKTQRKINKNFHDEVEVNVKAEIRKQLEESENLLSGKLLPQLAEKQIHLYYDTAVKEEHLTEVNGLFLSKVLAFIQPVLIENDLAEIFTPENNRIYFVTSVTKEDKSELQHYIIKMPSDKLQRFYELSGTDNQHYIILIDDIIKANLNYIFPNHNIVGTYSISFNRDSDLDFHDNFKKNVVEKIEKLLKKREHGPISRFLYQRDMPYNLLMFLKYVFKIEDKYSFEAGKYHRLADMMDLPSYGTEYCLKPWQPLSPAKVADPNDMFRSVNKSDILLHVPYQSYNLVLAFFNQAAVNTEVEEIYITLYRVAADSLIINSLISAAKNGKKVTAFVELKARFDEANNISWSKKMKDAGIDIIYSMPGVKVHSKMALIVKKGTSKKKMYSILGTGNFNEDSAACYSDHTLLTADKDINGELLTLFHFLQKRVLPENKEILEFSKICVSQFNLVKCYEKLIEKEIRKARKDKNGMISLKLNNLEDPCMVDLLYKASKQGVKIRLIIRSICTLVPCIEGLSENIEVKRIIGRYLEHSRIAIFGEPGNEEVYMGSADWMTRNLYHRLEVCVPVTEPQCKTELIDYFGLQWNHSDSFHSDTNDPQYDANSNKDAQHAIYKYLIEKNHEDI